MTDHSAIGKYSKRKGYSGEKAIADRWEKKFGGSVKRTPRSGGFAKYVGDDWAGDLIFRDNFFATQGITAECKYGYKAFDKRWIRQAWGEAEERGIIIWTTGSYATKRTYIIAFRDYLETIAELEDVLIHETSRFPKKAVDQGNTVVWKIPEYGKYISGLVVCSLERFEEIIEYAEGYNNETQ